MALVSLHHAGVLEGVRLAVAAADRQQILQRVVRWLAPGDWLLFEDGGSLCERAHAAEAVDLPARRSLDGPHMAAAVSETQGHSLG